MTPLATPSAHKEGSQSLNQHPSHFDVLFQAKLIIPLLEEVVFPGFLLERRTRHIIILVHEEAKSHKNDLKVHQLNVARAETYTETGTLPGERETQTDSRELRLFNISRSEHTTAQRSSQVRKPVAHPRFASEASAALVPCPGSHFVRFECQQRS